MKKKNQAATRVHDLWHGLSLERHASFSKAMSSQPSFCSYSLVGCMAQRKLGRLLKNSFFHSQDVFFSSVSLSRPMQCHAGPCTLLLARQSHRAGPDSRHGAAWPQRHKEASRLSLSTSSPFWRSLSCLVRSSASRRASNKHSTSKSSGCVNVSPVDHTQAFRRRARTRDSALVEAAIAEARQKASSKCRSAREATA